MLLDRRSLLLAFLAGLCPARASANVGTPADPSLADICSGLGAYEEGQGPLILHLLVSPGCDKAGAMREVSLPHLGRVRFRWIPLASGREEWLPAVANLLGASDDGPLVSMLRAEEAPAPSDLGMALARLQAAKEERELDPALWQATGRTPATPTTVYVGADGYCRVLRGAFSSDVMRALVDGSGF